MATAEEKAAAKQKLEAALQEYVRLSRDDVGNMFVQDYVVCIASESMDPGHENTTYFNHACRGGSSTYSIIGLLDAGRDYFKRLSAPRD